MPKVTKAQLTKKPAFGRLKKLLSKTAKRDLLWYFDVGRSVRLLVPSEHRAYGEGRIEVINSGYPMTHTGEQLEMLRKFGLQYDPDLVIHGFFAGNDFVDSHRYRKRIVVNDTTIDVDKRRERILFGYPIVPQSRLLHVVRQRVRLLAERIRSSGETAAGSDPADVAGAFSPQSFARIERARLARRERADRLSSSGMVRFAIAPQDRELRLAAIHQHDVRSTVLVEIRHDKVRRFRASGESVRVLQSRAETIRIAHALEIPGAVAGQHIQQTARSIRGE